jgi:enoyl-[acyl-carrier protein] reductase II
LRRAASGTGARSRRHSCWERTRRRSARASSRAAKPTCTRNGSRIVAAEAGDTVFTLIFGPEWPDGRVRTLRNRVVDEWRGRDDRTPPQPEPAVCIGTTRLGEVEYRMPKFSAMLPTPETSGDFEEMCLLAGESAAVIRAVAPAGEIVRQLVAEAEALLAARPLPSPGGVR